MSSYLMLRTIDTEIRYIWQFLKETRKQRDIWKAQHTERPFMHGIEFARAQELSNQLRTLFRLRALAR